MHGWQLRLGLDWGLSLQCDTDRCCSAYAFSTAVLLADVNVAVPRIGFSIMISLPRWWRGDDVGGREAADRRKWSNCWARG